MNMFGWLMRKDKEIKALRNQLAQHKAQHIEKTSELIEAKKQIIELEKQLNRLKEVINKMHD